MICMRCRKDSPLCKFCARCPHLCGGLCVGSKMSRRPKPKETYLQQYPELSKDAENYLRIKPKGRKESL
jgi:hypothetical protein